MVGLASQLDAARYRGLVAVRIKAAMPSPTAQSTEALAQLELALRDEEHARAQAAQARQALDRALERQVGAIRALQAAGVPTTVAAVRVARLMGEPMVMKHRLRLAARLRKRVSRVTRRHEKLAVPLAIAPPSSIPSDVEEEPMPRITRRKVTEEWVEEAKPGEDLADDLDVVDEDDDGEEDEDDDEAAENKTEKPAAKRRKRR